MRCVSLALLCFAAACSDPPPAENPSAAPLAAAPTSSPGGPIVPLPCDWAAGTAVHYRVERRRIDSRAPGLANMLSLSPAVLTVTGTDRLSLDIGATELVGPPSLVEAARAALVGFDLPPMALVVKDGQLVDVANRAELVQVIFTQIEAMLPPDTPPEAVAMAKAMYADPATATQLLLKEPNALLGTICMAMGDGERVVSSFESPGAMGGPALRSIVTIDATIRPEAGTATYTLSTQTDPESLRALTAHLLSAHGPGAKDEAPPPASDSSNVVVAIHSLADGLPISVEATQITVVGDNEARREDRWTWTRVPAP